MCRCHTHSGIGINHLPRLVNWLRLHSALPGSRAVPRMPAAAKATLEAVIAGSETVERILPEGEKNSRDLQIPACFSKLPHEVVKNFPHTKRVGNYLVGKLINKGSFAKVMEGLHIPTGQKVTVVQAANFEYLTFMIAINCEPPCVSTSQT
ncbi:hypothetical protein NDU88_004106 [Pleurodeles waltl]|uniref:Uncharacterized protein n=1 Tax=Pleurodeles waltl TaxID=8319 RepID=A0AAV7RKD4_PLEWA|nr:hypothetical protein NDU88_004106 [Pleurodeles waltl]